MEPQIAPTLFEAELDMTPQAQEKIYSLLKDEEESLCFRAQVIGGGCQGLSYSFSLDFREEDDYFKTFEGQHVLMVVVDALSHTYLKGACIDYAMSSSGEHFIVKNPNATGQCSCGSSFNA